MKLQLTRTTHNDAYTEGHLTVAGNKFCDTLEPSIKDPNHPCIPKGTYKVVKHWSHRFQAIRPMIDNVPNRKYILIHEGNYPTNTIGCILVGIKTKEAVVSYSRAHLRLLINLIKQAWDKGEQVTITIN